MDDVTFARNGQANVTRVCRLLSHSPGAAPDRGRSLVSGSTLGPAGVHPQIVAGPPNLAVLLTHCGQLILKKIVNLVPPDVRF